MTSFVYLNLSKMTGRLPPGPNCYPWNFTPGTLVFPGIYYKATLNTRKETNIPKFTARSGIIYLDLAADSWRWHLELTEMQAFGQQLKFS